MKITAQGINVRGKRNYIVQSSFELIYEIVQYQP